MNWRVLFNLDFTLGVCFGGSIDFQLPGHIPYFIRILWRDLESVYSPRRFYWCEKPAIQYATTPSQAERRRLSLFVYLAVAVMVLFVSTCVNQMIGTTG